MLKNINESSLEIDKSADKMVIELYIKNSYTPQNFLWEIFVDYDQSRKSS